MSGKNDGQTTMINTGSGVDVYQWDASQVKWLKIGNVVGSSGGSQKTSGKTLHEGVEYDYVFTVDIQEGAPPLKLPFNVTEEPWMAAQKFIYKHDLPQVYLEQVANFIIENTKGVTLGTGSVMANSDPFTGGDRYVPTREETGMNVESAASDPFTGGGRYIPESQSSAGALSSHFPVSSYLFFDNASPSNQIVGKLKEFNKVIEAELQLPESSLETLASLLDAKPSADSIKVLDQIMNWPQEYIFPAIDILRMAIKDQEVCKLFCSRPDFIENLSSLAFSGNSPATRMLSLRTLVNLFRHEEGRQLNMLHIDRILQVAISCKDLVTKNGQIAFSTLILNYCIQVRPLDDLENKSKCVQVVGELLPLGLDPEASYRLLVAIGTLIVGDDGCKAVSHSIDLPGMLTRFSSSPVSKLVECSKLLSSALS